MWVYVMTWRSQQLEASTNMRCLLKLSLSEKPWRHLMRLTVSAVGGFKRRDMIFPAHTVVASVWPIWLMCGWHWLYLRKYIETTNLCFFVLFEPFMGMLSCNHFPIILQGWDLPCADVHVDQSIVLRLDLRKVLKETSGNQKTGGAWFSNMFCFNDTETVRVWVHIVFRSLWFAYFCSVICCWSMSHLCLLSCYVIIAWSLLRRQASSKNRKPPFG